MKRTTTSLIDDRFRSRNGLTVHIGVYNRTLTAKSAQPRNTERQLWKDKTLHWGSQSGVMTRATYCEDSARLNERTRTQHTQRHVLPLEHARCYRTAQTDWQEWNKMRQNCYLHGMVRVETQAATLSYRWQPRRLVKSPSVNSRLLFSVHSTWASNFADDATGKPFSPEY